MVIRKKALGLQADLGRQATEMPENPMEADDTAAVAECSRLLGLKGLVRVWVGVDCGFWVWGLDSSPGQDKRGSHGCQKTHGSDGGLLLYFRQPVDLVLRFDSFVGVCCWCFAL